MTVRAILAEKGDEIFSVPPGATLQEVADELARRRIGAVLVMDGERLAGILSERDIVRSIASKGDDALQMSASSAMTQSVQTCERDELVTDVMSRMTASRFRHMPVVEGGRVIGLISIGDVVKHRIEEALRETDQMRAYILST